MPDNMIRMDVDAVYGSGRWDQRFTQQVLFADHSETENRVVNLYPEAEFETFEGFGGAVTDAAGFVYAKMTPQQKQQFLDACFSPEHMNYQILRIPLDSSDFSVGQHEALSDPEDETLDSFSFEGMSKYILPLLNDIMEAAGKNLPLLLSIWSPPAFMKTTGRREQGGKLKDEYRERYAEYLCRHIKEFRSRGFDVRRITLQNEPKAVQTWDSCIFTAQEEKIFLRDYMYPAMVRHGLADIEVFIWDHNKERVFEWMQEIIDPETDGMIAGAACHWYSGDHFEALDLCRACFPEKKLILSESCIELSLAGSSDSIRGAIRLGHEIIGDLNHGITAMYDWNLLLDELGGPNYVQNYCLAPFLYDTKEGRLKPQLIQRYYDLFGRYLLPGSVRIGMSRFTADADVTAWRRPDGSIVVFLLNKTADSMPVVLRMKGQEASLHLFAQSLTACVIR